MAYDHRVIVLAARRALQERPAATLTQVAIALQVDRHTVARAFRIEGLAFGEERRREIVCKLEALPPVPLSMKQVANILGCSSKSVKRWRARFVIRQGRQPPR
jgi:AraC-like DNA-binding protein